MSLLRYKKDLKYIVFDGESENVNNGPGTNRPWQLAWLVYENGKIKESFNKFPLIKDLNVSPDAARVTRFNKDGYLAVAEEPGPIYELFKQYYYNSDYLIVGQNVYFDWMLVKNLEHYLGIEVKNNYFDSNLINRIYDTSALAKAFKLGKIPPF